MSINRDDKVKEITDKLEQGIKDLFESKRYADFLKTMSKLHNYSFNNSLLISMQKPEATMVAGFTSWQNNFHRNVMKGEQGIKILAPSPYKINKDIEKVDPKTRKPVIGKDGQPVKERVQVTIPAYKVTYVWDVSQTQGEPLPEISTPLTDDVKDYERFLNAIQAISPVPIEFKNIESGANGYYHLEDKYIAIKEGLSQAQTLKTAIHELSHAILHDKDNGIEKDNQPDKRTKEIQAESCAFTVCSHFGLDTSDYSFGYIASWSSGREMDELKKSMDVIRATSSEIIKGLEEHYANAKREEMVESLATDIDTLAKDYDYYGYMDSVLDPDNQVENIKAAIRAGQTEHLKGFFKQLIEDKSPADMYMRAKDIVERIGQFKKEKPSVHSAEKTASVAEAVEMTSVVKSHHRSH